MPTTITKKIGSAGTGRDYATIAAALAAMPTNLVTADQAWVLELYNDSTFSGKGDGLDLSITGFTTDATRNIIMRPASGQGFRDNATSATALKIDQTKGVLISFTGFVGGTSFALNQSNFLLDGLQIDSSAVGTDALSVQGAVVKNCIVKSASPTSAGGTVTTSTGAILSNVLALNTSTTGNGFSDAASAEFHNCGAIATAGSSGKGFRGNYTTPLYKNSYALGFATSFANTGNSSNSNNLSTDTSATGTGSLVSKTAANQVVSLTTDARVKAGADLINAGVADATNTGSVDVIKQTRSGTTPTIGPWEYGAAATPTLTVTGTAPAGTVGTTYTITFTATGGTAPYTYSVGSGTLPPGLTLAPSTGILSGNPTTAGSYGFVIHAVDSTP